MSRIFSKSKLLLQSQQIWLRQSLLYFTIIQYCEVISANLTQMKVIYIQIWHWRYPNLSDLPQIGIEYMKSLNAKTDISSFINLRYLRLKLLKNKENNIKICNIFHHNFKTIPCYVTSEVSLKRFYFALFGDGLEIGVYRFLHSNSWYISDLFSVNFIDCVIVNTMQLWRKKVLLRAVQEYSGPYTYKSPNVFL